MDRTWSNLGPAVETDQFDEYGDAGQLSAETINQIATCLHGAPRRQYIVNDQHSLAFDDRVGVHLKRVLPVL